MRLSGAEDCCGEHGLRAEGEDSTSWTNRDQGRARPHRRIFTHRFQGRDEQTIRRHVSEQSPIEKSTTHLGQDINRDTVMQHGCREYGRD